MPGGLLSYTSAYSRSPRLDSHATDMKKPSSEYHAGSLKLGMRSTMTPSASAMRRRQSDERFTPIMVAHGGAPREDQPSTAGLTSSEMRRSIAAARCDSSTGFTRKSAAPSASAMTREAGSVAPVTMIGRA